MTTSKTTTVTENKAEEVKRVRVGVPMKWAPMMGYDVPDRTTGVDLILMSDGSVRWAAP